MSASKGSSSVSSGKDFPTLYGKASTGKVKEWTIKVVVKSGIPTTQIFNGYIDGKKALSERETTKGKNIGKKNETTPLQQALSEAEKKWLNKKEKEGYLETISTLESKSKEMFYPMLAQKFDFETYQKKRKTIDFPCFIQPKLDGIRCVASFEPSGEISLITRVGKQFNHLHHIRDAVKQSFGHLPNKDSLYLDGELYTDKFPFEEITGICRKEKLKPGDLEKLNMIEYHIFDFYDRNNPEVTFFARSGLLNDQMGSNPILKYVNTEKCKSIEEIKPKHDQYVQEGYEGIMLRNSNSPYHVKSRAVDLQKYKEFFDNEYRIIGFSEASGEDKGTIIWECEYTNSSGKKSTFSVRPRGSREKRAKYFAECNKDFSKYNGKQLTIRYQELSQDGCPRFPVGIDVRFDA